MIVSFVRSVRARASSRGANRSGFGRNTRGVAAVEFAFVAPFLIVCLLAGFEIAKYIAAIRHIGSLASSIAQQIAQNTTGTIQPTDVTFLSDSTMVLFPGILKDAAQKGISWQNDIQITMSGINFTTVPIGCKSSCTYSPAVAWSAGTRGLSSWRSCLIPPLQAPNTAPPSLLTLPVDTYSPGFLVVVDVLYSYTPFVATQLFNPLTIRRTFYVQPRFVTMIKFPGITTTGMACPGY